MLEELDVAVVVILILILIIIIILMIIIIIMRKIQDGVKVSKIFHYLPSPTAVLLPIPIIILLLIIMIIIMIMQKHNKNDSSAVLIDIIIIKGGITLQKYPFAIAVVEVMPSFLRTIIHKNNIYITRLVTVSI